MPLRAPGSSPPVSTTRNGVAPALPAPVVAVAGQPGNVRHQRVAAAREPVEQGRLADIGPADQSEGRNHARIW